MPDNLPPSRLTDRVTGLRALQRAVDECASAGTQLTAVFLDGGTVAQGTWTPTAGNGTWPLPRLAEPLVRQVRAGDLIVLLGGETLLCALPGMEIADGRRRFAGVAERLGGGALRLGVAGPVDGDSALDLAANAEADAPESADGASPVRLSLRLPADMRAARRARVALRLFEDELSPDEFAVLALVVTELVTNGVRHGSSREAATVLLDLVMSEQELRGSVVDQGAGFEPATASSDGPGGLGLMIVHRSSRRWGTADAGRRVWFEFGRTAAVPAE